MRRVSAKWCRAPAHASLLIRSSLAKHQIWVVPHPPCSPDLAPADFFLFSKLTTTLKKSRFQTIEEIQEQIDNRTDCHHRKCVPASIPTMEETLGTVYRQYRGTTLKGKMLTML
jgi:hypothetical protein